jgi:hypothetical protein
LFFVSYPFVFHPLSLSFSFFNPLLFLLDFGSSWIYLFLIFANFWVSVRFCIIFCVYCIIILLTNKLFAFLLFFFVIYPSFFTPSFFILYFLRLSFLTPFVSFLIPFVFHLLPPPFFVSYPLCFSPLFFVPYTLRLSFFTPSLFFQIWWLLDFSLFQVCRFLSKCPILYYFSLSIVLSSL